MERTGAGVVTALQNLHSKYNQLASRNYKSVEWQQVVLKFINASLLVSSVFFLCKAND